MSQVRCRFCPEDFGARRYAAEPLAESTPNALHLVPMPLWLRASRLLSPRPHCQPARWFDRPSPVALRLSSPMVQHRTPDPFLPPSSPLTTVLLTFLNHSSRHRPIIDARIGSLFALVF